MKRFVKVLFAIFIIIIVIFLTTASYGFRIEDLRGNQIGMGGLVNAGNGVVKVITTCGVVLSVIFLIILGIKYMIGSTDERAEYKKILLPYAIGAALVFAASSIAQIIYNIAISL